MGAISIKLQSNFIEIALRHVYSPVNLLDIFRTPFLGTPLGGCFLHSQITLNILFYEDLTAALET